MHKIKESNQMCAQEQTSHKRELLLNFLKRLNSRVIRSIDKFIKKSDKLPQIKQPSKFKLLHDLTIISAYKRHEQEFCNTQQIDGRYQEIEERVCSEVQASVGIIAEFTKQRFYQKLCYVDSQDISPHLSFGVDFSFRGQELISAMFKKELSTEPKVIEIDSEEAEPQLSIPHSCQKGQQQSKIPTNTTPPPANTAISMTLGSVMNADKDTKDKDRAVSNEKIGFHDRAGLDQSSHNHLGIPYSLMEAEESVSEQIYQSHDNDFNCMSSSEELEVFVTFDHNTGTIQPYMLGVKQNLARLHSNIASIYRDVAIQMEKGRHIEKGRQIQAGSIDLTYSRISPPHIKERNPIAQQSKQDVPLSLHRSHNLHQQTSKAQTDRDSLQHDSPQQAQQIHKTMLQDPAKLQINHKNQGGKNDCEEWFEEEDNFLRESVENNDFSQLQILLKYHSSTGIYERMKRLRMKVSAQYLEKLGQLSDQSQQ